MHTKAISENIRVASERLMTGTMTPDAAKGIAELARVEISNWRAQMEYARHTGTVAKIAQLANEPVALSHAA